MMSREVSRFAFGVGMVMALAASIGVAGAATCTPIGNTVTCTGGAGASITLSGSNGTTKPGTPFPTTINVTGGAGTVSSMSLTLHGYTSGHAPGHSSRDMGLLLVSPSGRNMEVLRCPGGATTPQSNLTVTLQDGAAAIPSCNTGDMSFGTWTTGGTFAPSAYLDNVAAVVNYAAAGAPALQSGHTPQNQGSATLNSTNGVFTGDTTNGNWSLYLVDDTPDDASVSFSTWDISITFSNASSPSTTTLTPNPTTAFTSANVSLTAQVTAGATGTVTFKEGNTTLTCSEGAEPRPLNGSAQAICTTTFSAEGFHSLSASYSGNGTFVASSGSAGVYTQNHASNTGTVYCNTGAINGDGRADLGFTHTNTYPSVIFVGDGLNTDLPNQVNTVSVQLKNFSVIGGTTDMHMLLVAPDGTHALDFWGDAGAGGTSGSGDYTLIDGSPILPNNTAISPGTYGPTSYFATDVFTPAPPSPAPQLPASFSLATPAGSSTFQTAFVGANAHGAWKLFLFNDSGSGDTTTLAGGWCLNIQPATGHPTTVTVTSNPFPKATKGASVAFTATIGSNPAVGNTGQVTFTEHGAALVGAANGGVSNVSNGVATTSTTQLPEGDHTITAAYHDASNTFNDMVGTVTMRVDANTTTPTLNGNTWTYCNPSGIVIPRGVNFVDDIGAAAPNPSNVFVTNLPGTINAVSLTLKSFHVTSPGDLDSLVVGPNGASAPTTAQTLDFFTGAGGSGGSTAFTHDTTFQDGPAVSCAPSGPAPGATAGPTSCVAVTPSYFASPFYNLPSAFQRATTGGNFTFDTGTYTPNVGGGVYKNTLPNGTWSLYFNQNIHHSGDGATAWCANFTENPVTVTATKGHTGRPPNGHFQQGHAGASFSFNIQNNGDSNGLGPTGDPDGMHPLTVVDVLDGTAFAPGALPTGSPWSCTAVTNTVTCKSSLAIAPGSFYPLLTIPVNVLNNAPASATNQGSLSGGGITATTSTMDMVTIDPAPLLAITKAHTGTFTQGSTAIWTLQVSNTSATAAGNTDGTTVTVTDTLPAGYTGWTGSGTGWMCNTNTNVVSCTSNDVVAGNGGMFGLITLTGTVPAASPVSVSNFAKAFGGGDVVHVTIDSAAMSNTDMVTVVQVPASITINGSSTQSATVNTAFGNLAVTVKDAGMVTIPNYMSVVFTAPASGPSGTFDNTTNTKSVTTGTGGSAGIADPGTFTANGTAGTYSVDVAAGPAPHATFNLTNVAPPTIAKAFGATFMPVNGTTTLTFTITNPAANSVSLSGLAFSDTMPAGLVVTNPPVPMNTCGGTLSAVNNSSSISLSNGTVGVNTNCTIVVTVTATTTGAKNNTTTAISSTNGGTGATSNTATVTVALPPTISKAFNPTQVPLGGTSSLTFTITNPNSGIPLTGLAFSDMLPAGLQVAGTTNQNLCNGTLTAPGGATTISLASGTVAAGTTCTISVDVISTTAGAKANTTGAISSTEGGTGTVSNTATLTVVAPPTISKSFNPTSVALNTNSTLSFTVTNPNTASALSGVGFNDSLPTGVVVAASPNITGSCGSGTITATMGTSSISLAGGTLTASPAAGSSCTFSVSVTGTTAGSKMNVTGAVTSTEGGTGSASNAATLTVEAPPSIAKVFNPASIALNATTALQFTITNPAANPAALTGVGFSDTLPTGLTVATSSATVCGGTLTTTNPTGITLTGATIALNTPCVFNVTVTGAASGQYTNTTGSVTSTNGGTGNNASANLTVAAPPTITKSFNPTSIPLNSNSTLSFTIANPNTNVALSGVAFTDSLPAGLVVAATPNITGTCGSGTITANAGASAISLSGGTLTVSPTVGSSCTFSVSVTGTTTGVKNNSVQVTSTEGGTGNTSNASLTVVGMAGISKSFNPTSVPLNSNSTLSFTITNPNTSGGLTGVAFTDTLPAGVVVAASPNVTGSCGGTVTAAMGSGSISLSGGTLTASPGAGSSCTFSVSVTGTTAGDKINITGPLSSNEGGTGSPSNAATLTVVSPPTISKAFGSATIGLGQNTSLTFTLTNPAANTAAQAGVAFTDTLPAGLQVANPNGINNLCGGSGTATAGGQSIILSGGGIPAGGNCTLSVNVKAVQVGAQSNTSGAVSSTNSGTGATSNTAVLTVQAPDLTVSKTHSPSNFTVNDTADTIPITVTNSGTAATSGTVTVTDTLPAGLTFVSASGAGWSCGAAGSNPVICTNTTPIAMSGTSALTLTVSVAGSTGSPLTNNVSVACSCTESNTSNNTNTDSIPVAQVVGITLATASPTGLLVSADGGATYFTAPHTFQLLPNSTATIVTQSPQAGPAGTQYVFVNWSDGGAISHTITVPAMSATYTATFKTQFLLTTLVSPNATEGSISPATGFFDSGSMVPVSATANAGYVFTGFSGGLSGTTTPQTITITAPATVTANFAPGPTGLGGSFGAKTGPIGGQRIWTVNIGNGGPGVALGTTVTSFRVVQTTGTACNPTVLTPMPVSAGDIAPGATAPAHVTIDFTGCFPNSFFKVTATVSANGGAATGIIQRLNQLQ